MLTPPLGRPYPPKGPRFEHPGCRPPRKRRHPLTKWVLNIVLNHPLVKLAGDHLNDNYPDQVQRAKKLARQVKSRLRKLPPYMDKKLWLLYRRGYSVIQKTPYALEAIRCVAEVVKLLVLPVRLVLRYTGYFIQTTRLRKQNDRFEKHRWKRHFGPWRDGRKFRYR